jgi:glc operon protein GlcG
VRAELPHKPVLSLAIAKKAAESAEAEAARRKATVVIAVVDDGGHLILLSRLDDTQVASVEVGIGKARTAAIFRRPSKVFEDQVRNGRVAALSLPGATPLQGGIPIVHEGCHQGESASKAGTLLNFSVGGEGRSYTDAKGSFRAGGPRWTSCRSCATRLCSPATRWKPRLPPREWGRYSRNRSASMCLPRDAGDPGQGALNIALASAATNVLTG